MSKLRPSINPRSSGGGLPDPSGQPDGSWLRTSGGAAVWDPTPAVTEADLTLSDVTTNNVSTTKHGFAPKLPNDPTKFLNGAGAYSVPSVPGLVELVYRYTVTGADKARIDTGADPPDAGSNDWTNGDVLEIWIVARTDDATAASGITVNLNADSGANYDRMFLSGAGSSASAGTTLGTTGWLFNTHGSGGSASYPAAIRLSIPNYAGTVFFKVAEQVSARNDATAGNNAVLADSYGWRSTAAITRFTINASAGQNLKVGSQLIVYKRTAS